MELGWKTIAGPKYNQKAEDYIKTLNFSGGGAIGITPRGRYFIRYIRRESKLTVVITNIKLFFIWLRGGGFK